MFADVSGFTSMSEQLSTLGKEGAEEITSIVNKYFERMLDICRETGGDLLRFGGDALLVFFDGEQSHLRALSAGHAMQEAMESFSAVKTSQGVFRLRMSIGIGSGPLFFATLGSIEGMDFLVIGDPLARMAEAQHQARPGQIVVDQSIYAATSRAARYATAGKYYRLLNDIDMHHLPAMDSAPRHEVLARDTGVDPRHLLQQTILETRIIEALGLFLPSELVTLLAAEPGRPLLHSSHRPVTVMFTNFYGCANDILNLLGKDHEQSINTILNTYFLAMRRIVTRYGGTINKLDPNITGNRIMTLFGALRAHEDDPFRAVLVGIEMNDALAEVNPQIREMIPTHLHASVGSRLSPFCHRTAINTGFVFAGDVGTEYRREYTVMGDQVNLTARLMSIAQDGEVLIGHSTAHHVEGIGRLEEQDAVRVKGISEPVRNYVVKEIERPSAHRSASGPGPMVGRNEELKLCQQAVTRAMMGASHVLVVRGESGIGKSRLVEETIQYAEMLGMDVLGGSCLSYGEAMAYHPWVEILKDHFGIDNSSDDRAPTATLESRLRMIGEGDWAPIIGSVLGLEIPDNDLTRDLDAKLRRQRILDLMVKIFQRQSQVRPLVLVIEDAHWADKASIGVIDYVARNTSGCSILLVLAHRPDDELPDWSSLPNAVDIPLGELSEGDCLRIIEAHIGPVELPHKVRGLILRKASGNPFFIEEIIGSLIDGGYLVAKEDGEWRFTQELVSVELPDTIHGIVLSRIDRLIELDRNILQVASVIGGTFSSETLTGLREFREQPRAILTRLKYLHQVGLVKTRDPEMASCSFSHLTTRDVVYESMAFEMRRDYHRRIGDFIELAHREDPGEHINILAYHYFEGHAWGKGMEYSLLAGRKAKRDYANEIAITSFRNALQAADNIDPEVPTQAQRLSANEMLGEVLTIVGRYGEASESLAAARDLVLGDAGIDEPRHHWVKLCRLTAEVLERQSEWGAAFDWLEKGLTDIAEGEMIPETSELYLLGAGLHHRRGHNDKAIRWCRNALGICRRLGTRESQKLMAHAYYLLGAVHFRMGNLEDALDYCRQSVEIYAGVGDLVGQALAYNNLAINYDKLGRWERASEAYHKSLDLNTKIGNIQEQGFAANNLANLYLYKGDWTQARSLLEQSNAIWKQIGAPLPDAVTMSNLAEAHIHEGNLAAANSCLDGSASIFAEIGSKDFLPELERRRARYFAELGDLEQAVSHGRTAVGLARQQEAQLELGISLRVLGDVYRARGDYGESEIAFTEGLHILLNLGAEYEIARTRFSIARLAQQAPSAFSCQEELTRALQTFERLGAAVYLEQARNLMARLDTPHENDA